MGRVLEANSSPGRADFAKEPGRSSLRLVSGSGQGMMPADTEVFGSHTALAKKAAAHAALWVVENTYAEINGVRFDRYAFDIFNRIQRRLWSFEEPIDLGRTTLDIGTRDGRYMSLIRALGPTDIKAIEPEGGELQKGIASGYVDKSEAFHGTLEDYLARGGKRADSAFIFNVDAGMATSDKFFSALKQAVKPGGTVILTVGDIEISRRLTYRYGMADMENLEIIRSQRVIPDRGGFNEELVSGVDGPNRFINIMKMPE